MFGSIGQTSSSEKPIAIVARIKSRGQEPHGLLGPLPPVHPWVLLFVPANYRQFFVPMMGVVMETRLICLFFMLYPNRIRENHGGVRLVGQQIEMSDDDVQYVVEIVCDAASEFAKRLHLLRLKQILLKGPLLSEPEIRAEMGLRE